MLLRGGNHKHHERLTRIIVSALFAITQGAALVFFAYTAIRGLEPEATRAAQGTPLILNYQGKLTNASGVTVSDGSYNVTIRIYDSATGGSCLYSMRGSCSSATAESVTVTSGIFTVQIGDSSDNTLSLNFNDDSYYIGVAIGSDSEMTPRKRILSSGYAINSARLNGYAASVTGGSNVIPATDNVGNLIIPARGYFGTSTTSTTSGRIYIDTASTSQNGIIVRGVNSQTANLAVFQDGAGNPLATIGANGSFSTSGTLGIGVPAGTSGTMFQVGQPLARFRSDRATGISSSTSATSDRGYGLYIEMAHRPTSFASTSVTGLSVMVDPQQTVNVNVGYAYMNAASFVSALRPGAGMYHLGGEGLYSQAYSAGAGSVSSTIGLEGIAGQFSGGGTVASATAVLGEIYAGPGTTTAAYNFYAVNPVTTQSPFVTTVAGGTLTNLYGLYVENMTYGTSTYGVYINGADTSALWVDKGSSTFGGHVISKTNNASDLGAFGNAFRNIYVSSSLNVGSGVNSSTISANGNAMLSRGLGIGVSPGSSTIFRVGSGSADANGTFIDFTTSTASTSTDPRTLNVAMNFNPTSDGTNQVDNLLLSNGPSSQASVNMGTLIGGNIVAFANTVAGKYTIGVIGLIGNAQNTGNGTASSTTGIYGIVENGPTNQPLTVTATPFWAEVQPRRGTTTIGANFYAQNPTLTGGALTNLYGLYVENLTYGTSTYGAYIAGANTSALWINSGTSTFGGHAVSLTNNGSDLGQFGNAWRNIYASTSLNVSSGSGSSTISSNGNIMLTGSLALGGATQNQSFSSSTVLRVGYDAVDVVGNQVQFATSTADLRNPGITLALYMLSRFATDTASIDEALYAQTEVTNLTGGERDANATGTYRTGLFNMYVKPAANRTVNEAIGDEAYVQNNGSGTTTVLKAFAGSVGTINANSGSARVTSATVFFGVITPNKGTIATGSVFYASNPQSTGGAVNSLYGLYVENLTYGSSTYGAYIEGAKNSALWINSGTSTFGGHAVSLTNNSSDLGQFGNAWRNIYASGSLNVGSGAASTTISASGNILSSGTFNFRGLGRNYVSGTLFVGSGGNGDSTSTFYTNIAATGTVTASCTGSCLDIAEQISSLDAVEAGDVVVVNIHSTAASTVASPFLTGAPLVEKSKDAYSAYIAGVVSTKPGITILENGQVYTAGGGGDPNQPAIALAGRVPVKVTNEGGTINPGDLLVSATTPGHAMKYDASKVLEGSLPSIVGIALEKFDSNTPGKILVLVRGGNITAKQSQAQAGNLTVTSNASGSLVYHDLDLGGGTLFNIASIKSNNGNWEITTDGFVVAKEIKTGKITIKNDASHKTISHVTIPQNTKNVTVHNDNVEENSRIFLTLRSEPADVTWAVRNVTQGAFDIVLSHTVSSDLEFDYWVIGVQESMDAESSASKQVSDAPPQIDSAAPAQQSSQNTASTSNDGQKSQDGGSNSVTSAGENQSAPPNQQKIEDATAASSTSQ